MSKNLSTSVRFKIKSEHCSVFSKKLSSLLSRDKDCICQLEATRDKVTIKFIADVDGTNGSLIEYEYIINEVDTDVVGITNVVAYELAEILTKFPHFTKENKPHTKEIEFIGNSNSLQIKTTIHWNEYSRPTKQTLTINTSKKVIEEETLSSIPEGDCIKVLSEELMEATDVCGFIKGDVTSRDDGGFFLKREGENLVFISTDLMMAARYSMSITGQGPNEFSALINPAVLSVLRSFVSGSEVVELKTYRNKLFVKSNSRKMLAPLLKTQFPIDSEFFFQEEKVLAEVSITNLTYILSHFITVNKDPFCKTTFKFELEDDIFRIYSGEKAEQNVDKIPCSIENSGIFIADARYISNILNRLSRKGNSCLISIDTLSGERISISSSEKDLKYLIQGLSKEYYV